MNKTIKEIAMELHVVKSTVSKAIHDLNMSPTRIGNRFVLSENQVSVLTKHILKSNESNEQNDSKTNESNESNEQNDSKTNESNESNEQNDSKTNESNESNESNEQNDSKTNESNNEMISALIAQLSIKDEQIKTMQVQLMAKDEQIGQLTAALDNMTTALTAAQALHAGTIQKQLTMKDEKSGGFFGRLFGRKKKEDSPDTQE